MALKAAEKMTAARLKLALDHPFFSFLAAQLRYIESETATDTCGTDGSRIYYNPKFIDKMTVAHMLFVLCHEILHIVNLHPSRRGGRDHHIWNAACDFAINHILIESGLTAPKEILHDEKYNGMTAEQIYDLLYKNAKHVTITICTLDDHKLWDKPGKGQCQGKDGKTSATVKVAEGVGVKIEGDLGPDLSPDDIRKMAIRAFHMAKLIGKVPAGLARMFGELMRPKVNPMQVLHRFVEKIEEQSYDWTRQNKKHALQGVYLPRMQDEEGLRIGIGVDTSGSIGDEELRLFMGWIVSIFRQKMNVKARIISCDCEVHEEFDLDNTKSLNYIMAQLKEKMRGGGGTDMTPIIRNLNQRKDLKAMVILTDGYWETPREKPRRGFPVLWGLTHDREVPFGQKILVEA